MGLSTKIAIRFLKAGKSQTLLIALGIAIGVAVQIFIGLLIQGLQESLIDRTIGNSSQITVTSSSEDKLITDWKSKLEQISLSDNRITNISASADSSVYLKFGKEAEPAILRGLLLDEADTIYDIKSNIYQGSMISKSDQVLIGKELKDKLGLKLGDSVEVTTATGKGETLEVVGFYDLKVAAINKSWVLTDLVTAQNALGYGDTVTSIEMQVSKPFKADEIATAIKNKLADDSLNLDNWKAQNEQLLSGLNGQGVSSIIIQIFVLISVILGIASVLAITVMQKSKQLGILKAMGVKDRTASSIFLIQGLMLGVLGAVLGIIFGVLLILMFTTFAVNTDGSPVVPIFLNYKFIALSALIAILSATLASLVPARKSSKLSPIEVIRNG